MRWVWWARIPFTEGEIFVGMSTNNPALSNSQNIPNLILDPQTRKVRICDSSLQLTRLEFRLFLCLVQRQPYLVSRQELLEAVWGNDVTVESRTVDSHIVRLRRKLSTLGNHGCVIETVWGLGYRLKLSIHEEKTFQENRDT